MKFVTFTTSVILIIFVRIGDGLANDWCSAGPIRIVVPTNNTYELEIDELRHIFEADEIKDRHLVVVSIAGASRQGKSFLLNFFLKFLYAQVNLSPQSN